MRSASPSSTGYFVDGVAAGLQALIGLPVGGPTEQDVLNAAAAQEVAVGQLGNRWHQPGDHPQGIIVGFGSPSEHAYPAALNAFAHVLSSCLP
jgi:GntR family transcriptional regulator/MocR family aminotransferase